MVRERPRCCGSFGPSCGTSSECRSSRAQGVPLVREPTRYRTPGLLVCVALALAWAPGARARFYTITDIGAFTNVPGSRSEAYGINDLGQVVGRTFPARDGT